MRVIRLKNSHPGLSRSLIRDLSAYIMNPISGMTASYLNKGIVGDGTKQMLLAISCQNKKLFATLIIQNF